MKTTNKFWLLPAMAIAMAVALNGCCCKQYKDEKSRADALQASLDSCISAGTGGDCSGVAMPANLKEIDSTEATGYVTAFKTGTTKIDGSWIFSDYMRYFTCTYNSNVYLAHGISGKLCLMTVYYVANGTWGDGKTKYKYFIDLTDDVDCATTPPPDNGTTCPKNCP